jgi:tetraacyldisaccharide 4'-kinase
VIAIARFLSERGLKVAVLTRGYGREGGGGAVTELDATKYGDEPVLIKKRAAYVDVIVGSNRYENGLTVTPDVYLLDDGFQHLQLHRDLDLVIDVPDPAFSREGRSALRDADIVIPRRLRLELPAAIEGKRVFAFAGLADNEQFFASLGANVVGTKSFRDHHRYTADDLAAIKEAARNANAEAIVTTEKDAVKIADDAIIPVPAAFVIEPAVLERILAAIR